MGLCPICSHGKGRQPLIAGLCHQHYWNGRRQKSAERLQEREIMQDESIATLISDLDIIFSRYVRLKAADLYGNVTCFTCGDKMNWKRADCGHFMGRGNMFLRYDERNTRVQCTPCNRMKDGNHAEFARRLEEESPGVVEILEEEARTVYKFTREELKSMIADYSQRLKNIQ